ncbi:cysteine-rich CWC family protein [Melaminivora sp.]
MSAALLPPHPEHCPLCQQPNACAMAAGLPAQHCWCMTAPVAREALQRIAPQQRGQACICPHCARPTIIGGPDHPLKENMPCPPTISK